MKRGNGVAKSRLLRGGNLKKILIDFGKIWFFGGVGYERKIRKKFLESLAVFLFFGEWGLKGKFEKTPKISVIFALFGVVGSERDFLKNAARRVGIFPFYGTDKAKGSQNAPPEL